jgi:hypothetical protein
MQMARIQSPVQTDGSRRRLMVAGLDADFAQHRHRRDVTALRDLLEHQRGVEDAELGTAIGLWHCHAEHSDFRQAGDVLPRKRAAHVLQAAGLELALG